MEQGPDALVAFSKWSGKDLRQHGAELALRAKKDAKVLDYVKKLINTKPIDPKNLTLRQKRLIQAIAGNSTQYSNGGQVVLGKWVNQGDGFVKWARETGSVHYNPHPEMWNMLSELGGMRDEVAWLVNQQVIQSGMSKGLPFEYSLNGLLIDKIETEQQAIEAIFSGASDLEITGILKLDYTPVRIKEIQELHNAGCELVLDEITNTYILIRP